MAAALLRSSSSLLNTRLPSLLPFSQKQLLLSTYIPPAKPYNGGLPRDDHVFILLHGEPEVNTAAALVYHAQSAGALEFDDNTGARCLSRLVAYSNSFGGLCTNRSMGAGETVLGYLGKDQDQPSFGQSPLGAFHFAHHAHFSNYQSLRTMLEKKGYSFTTTTNSEIIQHLMSMMFSMPTVSSIDFVKVVRDACLHLQGSYSMVFQTNDNVVAVRDAEGSRPLFMGLRGSTGAVVFTSEAASLDYVKAHKLDEVLPGYLYVVDNRFTKHYVKVNAIPIFPSEDNFSYQQFYLRLTALHQKSSSKNNFTVTPYCVDDLNPKSVFIGIQGDPEASQLCQHALKKQWPQVDDEASGAGIVTFDGNSLPKSITGVTDVFDGYNRREHELAGNFGIGYVGNDIPPLIAKSPFGSIAIAHKGHFSNYSSLRTMLEQKGYMFKTTSHAEVVLHLTSMISSSLTDLINIIRDVCGHLEGSYSMVFLTDDKLVAVRDPQGLKPLALGLRYSTGAIVFASETGALDSIEAEYDGEVTPGCLYVVDNTSGQHNIRVKCMAIKPETDYLNVKSKD